MHGMDTSYSSLGSGVSDNELSEDDYTTCIPLCEEERRASSEEGELEDLCNGARLASTKKRECTF